MIFLVHVGRNTEVLSLREKYAICPTPTPTPHQAGRSRSLYDHAKYMAPSVGKVKRIEFVVKIHDKINTRTVQLPPEQLASTPPSVMDGNVFSLEKVLHAIRRIWIRINRDPHNLGEANGQKLPHSHTVVFLNVNYALARDEAGELIHSVQSNRLAIMGG